MLLTQDQYVYTDENFSAVQTAVRKKDKGLTISAADFFLRMMNITSRRHPQIAETILRLR